jgi:hypothetical protein
MKIFSKKVENCEIDSAELVIEMEDCDPMHVYFSRSGRFDIEGADGASFTPEQFTALVECLVGFLGECTYPQQGHYIDVEVDG